MVGRASGAGGAIPCKFGGKRGRGSVFSPKAELKRRQHNGGGWPEMVTAGRLYGRRAAGGSGCCWGWGSVYYDLDGGRLCASGLLLTLSPSPLSLSALLGCLAAAGWNAGTGSGWAASGRSSAALRLGRGW